ncbi:MAG: DUF5317 domain-containing protein [Firmicutes bacterium]|nr:DUF5317 domain-containing protein [Bacillota bacterium]
MFIEVLVAAIIVGLLSRGKLANLGRLDFRYVYVIFAAFLIQVGIDFWAPRQGFWGYPYLHIVSYILLFFALIRNRRLPGVSLILAGTALNFVVVALNGGQMPVRADIIPTQLAAALAAGHGGTHGLLTGATRLGFLADRIYISFLNQNQLVSLGDIVIDLGVLILVILGMRKAQEI